MAYQTGTPASPVDLLQQMNTFLVANGWTSDKNAADGSGWETHLHNGAVYAHLCATVGSAAFAVQAVTGYALFLYLSDGFNGSALWNAQPTNLLVRERDDERGRSRDESFRGTFFGVLLFHRRVE